MSPLEDRCCHCVDAEILKRKKISSVIKHEKDNLRYSFFFLFMSLTFSVIPLTGQRFTLLQNGMYCCDCATHDKCQQLDCLSERVT